MDIEDFFSNTSKKSKNESQEPSKISVIDSFLVDPLIYNIDKEYDIIRDNPINCANQITQGMVNSAFITILDYAKGKGSWKLIPNICISAKGPFRMINLFFNKDIRDLNSIAVNSIDSTAVALLKIIMQEKYEIAPEFIYIDGALTNKLKEADAALLSGNEAFDLQQSNKIFMDLGDEWCDLTGLPFVYAVWAMHEMDFNQSTIKKIKSTVEYNRNNQEDILQSVFKKYGENEINYSDFIKNSISYQLGMEEKEAVTEFFRYAFFFGLIEHIPDLHFCE